MAERYPAANRAPILTALGRYSVLLHYRASSEGGRGGVRRYAVFERGRKGALTEPKAHAAAIADRDGLIADYIQRYWNG